MNLLESGTIISHVVISLQSIKERPIQEVLFKNEDGKSLLELVLSAEIENESMLLNVDSKPELASFDSLVGSTSDLSDFFSISETSDYIEYSSSNMIESHTSSMLVSSSSSPLGQNHVGLLELEVVAAENLPSSRFRPNRGGPQSPFVVVSLGRRSFKTGTIQRDSNPVWKERLYLPIEARELGYMLNFSVYNYRSFGDNNCVGTTRMRMDDIKSESRIKVALALELTDHENVDLDKPCRLLLKCSFYSMNTIQKGFWRALCKRFSEKNSDTLTFTEFEAMLGCIGPNLSEDTWNFMREKLGIIHEELSFKQMLEPLFFLNVTPAEATEDTTVHVGECPVCTCIFPNTMTSEDIFSHTFTCGLRNAEGKLEQEMMGGFLTEEHASRKWIAKLFTAFGFGHYELGKNNANIFVHDRRTGKLVEEKMPAYIRLGIRLIYQKGGRTADAKMVRRLLYSMTLRQGQRFSSVESKNNILPFIKFHKLNTDEVLDPIDSFQNFNEFFYRRLKPGARPALSLDIHVALMPADCRLIAYPTINEATELWIKGRNFSISSLLKDEQLGDYFSGGSVAVCRLAPQDYHRFHCPFEAKVTSVYHIEGSYLTVNPMAIRKPIDVLTENARTVVMLDSPIFGKVAYVAVGAMMVGSILITCKAGQTLNRLGEIGFFAFGGSTIVLIFPKDRIQFDADLVHNSKEPLETLVRVGQTLGSRTSKQFC